MEIQIGLDFEEAFFTTGCHLRNMMIKNNYRIPQDCKCPKGKIANKSYFDISIIYKNKFYAILIDIRHNNSTIFADFPARKEQLIKICEENDLIPCIFPLNMALGKQNGPHGYGTYFEPGKNVPQEFTPLDKDGWNLIHAVTDKPVIIGEGATDEIAPMSKYEQYFFATDVAKEIVSQRYGEIVKWNDVLPGNEPQLVFMNHKAKPEGWEWCRVKVVDKPINELSEEEMKEATHDVYSANPIFTHNGIYFLIYIYDKRRAAPGHKYSADIKKVIHTPNEIID